MKIAWIVPRKRQCGICLYAAKYETALAGAVTLITCDPEEFVRDRTSFAAKIRGCDCAHIQYESSFYFARGRDFYPSMCRAIPCKKVVTLHEVYRTIPGVFPRQDIRGFLPVKKARQMAWDLRHPHWAAFARHAVDSFFADAILVHARFHCGILEEKGVDISRLSVIPVPIKVQQSWIAKPIVPGETVTLGATGFINPLYDYDLLLKALERLEMPWRFVWVGGVRRDDDASLMRSLQAEIDKRSWSQRFTVTGLAFGEERDRLLADVQIFCALFKDRSSSESLADAISAHKYIVATRIPLTEELVSQEPLAILADPDADKIAARIRQIISDEPLRRSLDHGCAAYCERFSVEACSRSVVEVYERLLST
jgi:glycosyltransferase involved in cell wall biosynthesis